MDVPEMPSTSTLTCAAGTASVSMVSTAEAPHNPDSPFLNWTGMHFGTFIGAESESLEAIIELAEAIEDAGVKPLDDPNEDELGRMGVIDVGETWCTESE